MKILKNIVTFVFILLLTANFADSEQLYKSYPVVDYKTDIELMRTLIPDDFTAQSKVVWSRNIETPLSVKITAENPEKHIVFDYVSPKTYTVIPKISDSKILSSDMDKLTNIHIKNEQTAVDVMKNLISETSPQAESIELISEKTFSKDVLDYMLNLFYQKTQSYYKNNMKMNENISNISITKQFFTPNYCTFSYKENGKEYMQTFVTANAGFEYDIAVTKPVKERKSGKIIENYGIFSYKAPKYEYENYKNEFLIFAANTMFNRKTPDTLERVKIQRFIELSPTFSQKRKKEIPSNLFIKYYSGGKADYAEYSAAQIPQLDDVRWIIMTDNKFEKFDYRTLFDVWRQKIYTTSASAFYNRRTKEFLLDEPQNELSFPWVQLKKAVDIQHKLKYDSGF